jgi:hypothetical protein
MPSTFRTRVLLFLLALVAIILIPQAAFSQRTVWPDAAKIIQQGWFYTAIPDGRDGAVLIVGSDYEKTLQRVNGRGERLWGEGIALPLSYNTGDHMLIGDQQHGFLVVTYAPADDGTDRGNLQVRKLNAQGHIEWVQNLTSTPSRQSQCQTDPTVLRDGSVVVLFYEISGDGHAQCRMQRLSPKGARQLGGAGVPLGGAYDYHVASTIGTDGSVYVATETWVLGSLGIAVRCFGPNGGLRWTCGFLPLPNVGTPEKAVLAPLDDGGVICLWGVNGGGTDDRAVFYPKLQRLSKKGKPMWMSTVTVPFPGYEYAVPLGLVTDSRSVMVWGTNAMQDIIACKYDLNGHLSWKKDRVLQVCAYPYPCTENMPYPYYQYRNGTTAQACTDKTGDTIFAWIDGRDHDIAEWGWVPSAYVTKLDAAGRFTWTANGCRVPNATYYTSDWRNLYTVHIVTDGNGGLLMFGNAWDADMVVSTTMQRVVPADSPPPTPIVQTQGGVTYSLNELSATMQSADRIHPVIEYEYAVSSQMTEPMDVIPWTSNGSRTTIKLTGLSLRADKAYSICARAKNSIGLWSSHGWSVGAYPVEKVSSLAEALDRPIGWRTQPPSFTIIQSGWIGCWGWIVQESPDGPTYKIHTTDDANPGDVVTAICAPSDTAIDDEKCLDIFSILKRE